MPAHSNLQHKRKNIDGESDVIQRKMVKEPTTGFEDKRQKPVMKRKDDNAMGESQAHDFGGVRIHKNSSSAVKLDALAYTRGNDIHFAPGQYNPGSSVGKRLIHHELGHVVQQRRGEVKPTKRANGLPVNDNPALEKEADVIGASVSTRSIHNQPTFGNNCVTSGSTPVQRHQNQSTGNKLETSNSIQLKNEPTPMDNDVLKDGPADFMKWAGNSWNKIMDLYKWGVISYSKTDRTEKRGMNAILRFRKKLVFGYIYWYANEPDRVASDKEDDEVAVLPVSNEEQKKTLKGAGEGSEEPTSDIDINLMGEDNIAGCLWINQMFRKKHGNKEWAYVYNVNYYAKDFLEGEMKSSGTRVDQTTDLELSKFSAELSTINALLHLREMMEPTKFKEFYLQGTENNEVEKKKRLEQIEKVEKAYVEKTEFLKKFPMREAYDIPLQQAYEAKLEELRALPRKTPEEKKKYAEKLHEVVRYAPDAYYSQGAVMGTVVNKQIRARGYKNKEVKDNVEYNINQQDMFLTQDEKLQSVLEQAAFIFEHLQHIKEDAELIDVYKEIIKYYYRFWNAMKHLTGKKYVRLKGLHTLNGILKKDVVKDNDTNDYRELLHNEKTRLVSKTLKEIALPDPYADRKNVTAEFLKNIIRNDVDFGLKNAMKEHIASGSRN